MHIIGRKQEQTLLQEVFQSKQAEFVAVYGRRRVGKTFLIRSFFEKKNAIYFEAMGLKDGSMKEQLEVFADSFSQTFSDGLPIRPPNSWKEAFALLSSQIDKLPTSQKIVVFLDELPWMATRRSGFIQALDHYWNTRGERCPNLKLIVCGSAAAWMLEKLINSKGGLYNRLTRSIRLNPFSLSESRDFLESRGIKLDEKHILELYMILGGIPHYLKEIRKSLSVSQNINEICFQKSGLLFQEFPKLFASLYSESEVHYKLIRTLAQKRRGIPRADLLKSTGLTSGGTFSKRINELVESGFVTEFRPYKHSRDDIWYRVIDEYTIFYLKWIEPLTRQINATGTKKNYWEVERKSPSFWAWSGLAFESTCLKHITEIEKALNLESIAYEIGTWQVTGKRGKQKTDGAQIDLLFDRSDESITICEIKHSNTAIAIEKKMALELRNKLTKFLEVTKTKKQVFLIMITTKGLKQNIWTEDLVDGEVLLNDLFEKV